MAFSGFSMIKTYQKYLNRIHVLLDAAILVASYVLSWFVRFRTGLFRMDAWYLSLRDYCRILILLVPAYLILYGIFQLYTSKRVQGRRLEAWHLLQANVIGLLAFLGILYIFKQPNFSRTMIFIFFCINLLLELLARNLLRFFLRGIRRKGLNQKHILLVGYSRAAEQYIDRIMANPEWGYALRGILDDRLPIGTEYKGVKVIGSIENLLIILPQNSVDEIAITLGIDEYGKLDRIVAACEKSGVHTKFIPDYHSIIPTRPYTEDLNGLPVVNIRSVPLSSAGNRFLKRAVDILGALFAILLFSPLMLVVSILIKATSPGPLIFKQVRVGWKNQRFDMYKFRSMVVQDAESEKKGWTTKDDPRITRVGRWIRKTSVDELPQLFNVLAGDMSLVGPRPERPQFVEEFQEKIPRYMVKHQVRPGLTGWAQVNGYRGDTSIEKRIEHDLYYIENWTLGLDFKIILMTFFKGFVNKNAY